MGEQEMLVHLKHMTMTLTGVPEVEQMMLLLMVCVHAICVRDFKCARPYHSGTFSFDLLPLLG